MKRLLWIIVLLIIIIGGGWYLLSTSNSAAPATTTTSTGTTPAQTYGMQQYSDPTYGFSFWFPAGIAVTASSTDDSTSYPGGTELERINVGNPGSIYIAVVESTSSTITDEPNGHAAPISQTKYFYDASSGQWMVAYPEGSETGDGGATTTANTSKTTVGGLPMLPSSARFDTTIIPLSKTEFLLIGDGGGSSFTEQLAQTVSASGATVDPTALESALQAEANAYNQTNQPQQ